MNDLLVLLVAGICFLLGIFTGDIMHILLDDWRRSGNTSLREDAKLHYDEWCDSCQEYDHDKHCCPRWNKVIKNTVEELKAAQSEPCLIPVEQELPKIGEYVLCETTACYFGKYHVCKFVDKDKWVDKPHFDWDHNGFPHVIAWMPLPESYKEAIK